MEILIPGLFSFCVLAGPNGDLDPRIVSHDGCMELLIPGFCFELRCLEYIGSRIVFDTKAGLNRKQKRSQQ